MTPREVSEYVNNIESLLGDLVRMKNYYLDLLGEKRTDDGAIKLVAKISAVEVRARYHGFPGLPL